MISSFHLVGIWSSRCCWESYPRERDSGDDDDDNDDDDMFRDVRDVEDGAWNDGSERLIVWNPSSAMMELSLQQGRLYSVKW